MKQAPTSAIVPRKPPFDFPDDINPQWVPGKPEFAHLWNGVSLTMPYLEPYLIRTMREGLKHVEDPEVLADGRAFMAQEGHHYKIHQRFNEFLKNNGYPELAAIEEDMKRYYQRLEGKSLTRRMAYSAGFESMTLGVTRYLIGERKRLYRGADTRVASFWLWHMTEETEHKTCAFDAYQAACGHYFARCFGVFHGTFGVLIPSLRAAILMLKKDGLWKNWRSRYRLLVEVAAFFRHVGPYMLRALLPHHSPRFEKDPEWVIEFLRRYPAGVVPTAPPLIDTNDPEMPVPEMSFTQAPAKAVAL